MEKSNSIGLIIKAVIIIPIIIFGAMVMFSGINVDTSTTAEVNAFAEGGVMSGATIFSFAAIALCAVLIVVFFVYLLVTDPIRAIKSILGIIVAAVIFLVLYFAGTSTTPEDLNLPEAITASQKTVDFTNAGVVTAFIAIGAALLAIVGGLVLNLVRKN
ncbi:MAG: hypothetical protein ACPGU5_01190 [Lishizhenia sp.]